MTKSKSFLIAFVCSALLFIASISFVGCNPVTVTGIEIDETTVQTAIKKDLEFTTTDIVVNLVKSDESKTVIEHSNLTFSTINTSTTGKKTLTVTYKTEENKDGYTDSIKIGVYDELSSIQVQNGSYSTTLARGATYDTSTIVVIATYEDNITRKIAADELSFSEIDNSTLGEKTMTISYTDGSITKTCDVIINIVESNNYAIIQMDEPESISLGYNINSQLKNTFDDTYSTGTKGFEVTGNMYVVGSTNAFIYNPYITVQYTGQKNPSTIYDFELATVVYLYNETRNEFEELSGSAMEQYVDFDGVEHTYQFKTPAEDKQFKIVVYPASMEYAEAISGVIYTDLVFKVINGYNIYDAAGLSAIDNANVKGKWTEYKQANNIPLDIDTTSFILHNNITIERDDLPAVHYWTADEVSGQPDAEFAAGSLKDALGLTDNPCALVYNRVLKSGEDFVLEGNYFTVSAQNIPLMYRQHNVSTRPDPEKAITTHTALFGIMAEYGLQEKYSDIEAKVTDETYASIAEAEDALIETCTFNNIALMGNSNKSEDALLSGGILMQKIGAVKSKFYNNLAQRWCISYFAEGSVYPTYEDGSTESYLTMTLDKTNVYDGYNTLIYNYGNTLKIKESHLIGAGGPVMICDNVNRGKNNEYVAHVYTDKASVIQSYVAGSEGWFATYEAASILFGMLKAQDIFFNNQAAIDTYEVAKSMLKTDSKGIQKVNLVAAFKDSGTQDATTTDIKCSFTTEGDEVNMSLNGADSYVKFTELTVLSRMLDGADTATVARAALDGIKQGMVALGLAQNVTDITDYQAFVKLMDTEFVTALGNPDLINANTLVLSNIDSNKATIQGATSQGIIYYGNNGMICMPANNLQWGIAPNKELYKNYEGYLYASIQGNIGAVLSIENIETPSASQ